MEDYNHLIISQVDEVDDVYMDTNIIRSHNIHENAIYTSQLIDFCSLRRINHLNESPIDALLKRHLIDIIPYEQFSEIQLISHGGYSSMYSAFWKERGIKVAMKMFRDVFNLDFGFLSSLNSCLNLRNYEIGSCTRITEQFVKCEKSGFTDPANFYICEDDDSYYSRNFTDWKKDLCFY
ncbi:9219_t:CDS:2 [Rhizophagus irregularis]|nr:9219_t:CDS:2 [Rhizophagus irregularis]